MDERSILLARIGALEQELDLMEQTLKSAPIDEELCKRVINRFRNLVAPRRQDLQHAQARVADGGSLDRWWNSFVQTSGECAPIFSECLAFMQGVLARQFRIDGGLCEIADSMLRDLNYRADTGWRGATILAEGELFEGLTAIIRLRFPEVCIWNLPVAVHEFGHFIVQEMEEMRHDGQFQMHLDANPALLPSSKFLHEYYADVFATYCTGPAYAYTCLLLRFDPATAYTNATDHPSDARRTHAILRTLEEMNRTETASGYYTGPINSLQEYWQANLAAIRPIGEPPSSDELRSLTSLVRTLYRRLREKFSLIQYDRWQSAVILSGAFTANVTTPTQERGMTIIDVVNAAWLARLRAPEHTREIGVRAVALCRALAQNDMNHG